MPTEPQDELHAFALGPLREHLTWIASVGLFLVVVLKILRVAGGDVSTALALIQAGGPVSVTFGIIVTCLPSIVFALGFTGAFWHHGTEGLYQRSLHVIIWVSVLVLCCLTTEALPLTLVLSAYGWPALRRWKRNRWPPSEESLAREAKMRGSNVEVFLTQAIPYALAPLFFSVLQPDVWLPPERLRLKDGKVSVGYVVAAEDRWLTLLDHGTRHVTHYETADVGLREVCALYSYPRQRTVLQWITRRTPPPPYPSCWR